jgi:photosystem II stability/assembly factor-like uncharacterized protein
MKPGLFLLFTIVLVTACNAPASQTLEVQSATEVAAVEATATAPQTVAQPESVPQEEINAPIVEAPSILSLAILDAVNGWGVTETQIIRTNDGGVTWYNVTPPEVTEIGYSISYEFLDASHAWILFADPNDYLNSGMMYRTADGGLTWTSNIVSFGGGDMSFLDSTNGWILADLGVGAGSMVVSIFQTTDGGATWNRTYTNDPNVEGAGESLPRGGLKNGITAFDMQTAWVGGVVYAPGSIYVFRTDDAGASWKQVSLELPPEAQSSEVALEKIQIVSPTQAFLILRITSDNRQTIIYQSNDGGSTWSPTPAKLPTSGQTDIVSAQEIVFYSSDQFYVTKDAATTWSIIAPDTQFGDSISAMDFATSQIGWVITSDLLGHRTLYRTEDGGSTWFPIIP